MDDALKSNPIMSAIRRSIKPDYPGGTSDKNKTDGNKSKNRGEVSRAAAGDLRTVDEAASGSSPSQIRDNLGGVRENEERASGFYSGRGRSVNEKIKKGRFGGFLKKRGPIIAIIVMIFGVGATSFLGVSTELMAWKENVYSMFGQGSAIINRRSNYMVRRLLNTNRNTTSNTIFGGTRFKISTKLADKLKTKNINYIDDAEDANGKRIRMLVFEDTDGRLIPIVASENDIQRASGIEVEIGGERVRLSDVPITLDEARSTNRNFNISYDEATMTFTGKIAGWFDNVTDSMYERLIGRNARNQTDIEDPDEESANKMLLSNASDGVENSELDVTDQYVKDGDKVLFDDEGKPIPRNIDGTPFNEIAEGDGRMRTGNPGNIEASLTARAKKAAMMGSTIGCAFLKGIGAISAAVGAVQTMNVIQYASKYLEMADKIKYGDADETVNVALNNLNKTTTVELYDMNGEKHPVTGSVTSGDGWNAPFASTNIIDENSPSALLVNRELANKNALNVALGKGTLSDVVGTMADFGAGITAFRACNAIQGAVGAISGIMDAGTFFTFGLSKLIKDTIKGAVEGAKLTAAMIAIGTVVALITPAIGHWFAGMLTNIFLGANGGFALLSGAQNIMNSNLQMSTGRYANNENAVEVFGLTQDVEREWAEYERATKSPFDVTSKYTFLGSIYNAALPIANLSRSTMAGMISSVANLTQASTLALTSPSAHAANDINKFSASLASEGNCGYLQAVGVAGDFACNKYSGAYVNELTTVDPETIYEKMNSPEYDSFLGEDSDGNPKINANSEYAKYIVACVTSDTQPGTMSGIVQGFINKATTTEDATANGLINFGRSFVPFEGFLDAAESAEQESNIKWNSGLACTGNTDDSALNERVKNYSMYNLDQRVLYDMGIIEHNSTVSFLEEYYKENPLDNSFEGRVARFSGMTKEEVEDTLALIEYYQFLNEYDASTRYAFGRPRVEIEKELKFDNENENEIANQRLVLLNQISFADIRNKNFAV